MKPTTQSAGGPRIVRTVVALFTLLVILASSSVRAASMSDFIRWDLKENPTATPNLRGLLHVPSGYTASQSYPIIIFFHGAGQTVSYGGADSQIDYNIDQLLNQAKANNAFLLAPQAQDNWNADNTTKAMFLAASALRQYNIDPNKVYITGLSLGGGATWLTLKNYNGIAAASLPVCGVKTAGTLNGDNTINADFASRLVGKNIWAFHAANDPTVSVGDARAYISAILTAGGVTPPTFPTGTYPAGQNFYSSGNLSYTEYQTGGHGIWPTVYGTNSVFAWLFGKINSGLDLQVGEKINFHLGNALPLNDGSYTYWNSSLGDGYKLPGCTVAFARTGSNRQTRVSLHTTGTFGTGSQGNSLPTDQTLYGNNGGNSGWGTTYSGTGALVISGLIPSAAYDVKAFGAQNVSYFSNTTRFTVGSQSINVKTYNNTGTYANFSVNADANGEIAISVVGSDTGSGNGKVTGYINTISIARNAVADPQAPVVDIVNPTNLSTYSTSDPVLNLGGSALDNVGVTSVTWVNDRGGSGSATGLTNWLIGNIPLLTGTNVITVSAFDAAGNRGFDTLTVTYSGSVPNQAPVTSSGTNQTITLATTTVTLNGSVTDDGLPANSTLTSLWSKLSGPASVTFGNVNSATTTATFTTSGTYVLRLTGSDGALSSTSDVTIIVNPTATPTPTPSPSPTPSGTTGILTPFAWGAGTAAGNYVNYPNRMFNVQPTWDGTNNTPVGGDTGGVYDGYIKVPWDGWHAVVYIDFGPDWANKRIQQTWTKYITARGDAADPYYKLWWDNNQDNVSDTAAGNIAETTLNFDTQAHVGGEWKKDVDVTSTPIAPKGRYLKMMEGNNRSDDPNEYCFVGYTVSATPPTQVIPIAGCGSVITNGALNATRMFNAQPTWDAANNRPVGGDTGDGNTGYFKAGFDAWQNKVYIDFGPNWQNVRIQQTWTKYIVGRANAADPYAGVYWDDDNDNTMDSGAGNAVLEPTINFDTKVHAGGDWVQDVDVTTAPITPKGRYLIMTEGYNRSADANELVVIGYIVP